MIKKYYKLFWLVLLLQTQYLAGQDSYIAYEKLSNQFKGETLQIKVDSLLQSLIKKGETPSLARVAHSFAIRYARQGDPLMAIKYGRLEVEELKAAVLLDTTYTKALYNLGRFYIDNGEYKKAIPQFEEVIELNNLPWRVAQSYTEIARCYRFIGDYFKAVDFFKKGFALLEALESYKSIVIQSINLAWAYEDIGTPKAMEARQRVLDKADSLRRINGISLTIDNYRNLLNAFAYRYITKEYYNFEKAQSLYIENLKSGMINGDSTIIAMTYNNLANLYNKEQRDSAVYFIKKGFQFVRSGSDSAKLFDNQSDYHLHKGELEKALTVIHKALETSLQLTFNQNEAPNTFQLSNSNKKDYVLFCLKKKTEILIRLYEQKNDQLFLEQVLGNVKAADQLIDMIQSESLEESAKLFWRKEAAEIYLPGAYASRILGDHQSTFFFMEKNKALVLSEEVSKNTAYSMLPKNVSKIERDLKGRIFELENTDTLPQSSTAIFDAKRAYEEYIESIKHLYPEYFRSQFGTNLESLLQIQSSLEEGTTLVSYIWNVLHDNEEIIIGMALDKRSVNTFEIPVTDSLKSLLTQYRKLNLKPLQTQSDQVLFLQVSHDLFNNLFPGAEVNAMARNKKLTIIPDGDLQTIPFEALIVNTQTHEYLLEKTDVNYLYSVSFLRRNENVIRQASRRFIAYAPVNFEETGLLPLNKTRQELKTIESQIGGDMRIEVEASKEHFLSESSAYSVIHLATHANASGDPWIAFSDGKMKLYELYTYKNNAELVTLSACNTLLGEIANGEGVLSLSRGFFYSGSKSVVASLWNVNDQATSSIMADFYANLKAGQGKSEALNNAKRNYLKTHSLSEQSPYYWSSFVLLGDDQPIDFSSNNYHWYLIGILMIILLVFIFMKKTKKIG